jgi:hypothetical protein
MELTNLEVAAVRKAALEADELQAQALNDLELALVGGGIGEVVFG